MSAVIERDPGQRSIDYAWQAGATQEAQNADQAKRLTLQENMTREELLIAAAVETAMRGISEFAQAPLNAEQLAYAFDGLTADERADDSSAVLAMDKLLADIKKLGDPDAKTDFVGPTIKVGVHGETDTVGKDEWLLPSDDVLGAFISPEESNTEGGILIISEKLLVGGAEDRLAQYAMEELGEALGVYAASEDVGVTVAEGDVGARILKVTDYSQLGNADFVEIVTDDDDEEQVENPDKVQVYHNEKWYDALAAAGDGNVVIGWKGLDPADSHEVADEGVTLLTDYLWETASEIGTGTEVWASDLHAALLTLPAPAGGTIALADVQEMARLIHPDNDQTTFSESELRSLVNFGAIRFGTDATGLVQNPSIDLTSVPATATAVGEGSATAHNYEYLAVDWGVSVERAEEIMDEVDATLFGPPYMADAYPIVVGWSELVDHYGVTTPGQLTAYELGHALADGMVTTELAHAGDAIEEGDRTVNFVDMVALAMDPPERPDPEEEVTDPDEIILAVSEDDEAGTVAGDVAALGAEGATFVLSEGNSGNFELNGTQLVVSADAAFDFDLIPTEMVTIDVTEGDVTTTRSVAVEIISDGNTDPTNITLSSNTVAADAAANTEIGTLSTTDAEDSGFNYTIIGGDTDEFKIDGNKLMVATPLTQGDTHYSIDVQVTDADGNTFVKTLVIQAGTGISDEDQRRDPGKFLFAAANEVGIEGLEEYMIAAIESGDTNEGGVLSWGEEPPEVLKRAAIKFAISNDAGDLYTTDKVALFMNALSDARRHQESIPDIGTEGLVFDGLEGAGIAAKGHLHVLYNYLEETDGAEAATAFVTEVETHWDSTTLTFDPAYTATLLDLTNAAKELYLEGEVGDNLYDATGNRVESRYGAQKAQLAAAYDIYGGGAMEAYGEDDAKIYLTNLTDVEAITQLHVLRDAGEDHVHNHLIDEGHPTTYEDFGEEHRNDLSLHEGLATIWATVEEAATYVGGVATNIYRTGVELLDFGKQIANGEIDLGAFIAETMGDEYLAMSDDLAREGTISRQLSDLAATDDLDHVGKFQVALDIAELFDWAEGATTGTRFGNMRSDGNGVHLRSTVNMPHQTELADGTIGYTGGLDIQLITMGFQGALTYPGGLAAGITYSSNAFNYQATGSTEANMVENFITGGGAHEYKTGAGLAGFVHLPSISSMASQVMDMGSQAYNNVQGWFGGSSEAAIPNPADAGIPSASSNWDLGAVGSIVQAAAAAEFDASVSAGYSRTWDMDAIPGGEFLALLGGNIAGMTAGGLGAIYAGGTSEKAIMAGLQLGMILEDSVAAAIAPDGYVKEEGFGAAYSLGATSGWANGAVGEGDSEYDVLRGRLQWAQPIWGQDTGFAGSVA